MSYDSYFPGGTGHSECPGLTAVSVGHVIMIRSGVGLQCSKCVGYEMGLCSRKSSEEMGQELWPSHKLLQKPALEMHVEINN